MSAFWLLGGVVVLVILAQLVLRAVIPKAPSTKTFGCARCSATTLHDERTVFAWQHGERDFYCDSCNEAWLASCTPAQRTKYARNMARLARAMGK